MLKKKYRSCEHLVVRVHMERACSWKIKMSWVTSHTTSALAEEMTWATEVMISSWWGWGRGSAGCLWSSRQGFAHTRRVSKQEHKLAQGGCRCGHKTKGRVHGVQIPNDTWFLLWPSFCLPVWWLASDSAFLGGLCCISFPLGVRASWS